jgi:competence protein ComEA
VLININTASAEELTALPGIGEQKAAAIVEYREANGPFQTVEDLLLVPGIGETTLDGLIDQVTVDAGQ